MLAHVSIGSSPSDESCAQLGSEGYTKRARAEINALMEQMIYEHPALEAIRENFHMHANSHDFGVYYELCIRYDENDENMEKLAFLAEDWLPNEWNTQSLLDLKNAGIDVNVVYAR